MKTTPYDFAEAAAAHHRMAKNMRDGEQSTRDAFDAYAEAEKAYRMALAMKIADLRSQGIPATVCSDMARGDEAIAELKMVRDSMEGVREAAKGVRFRQAAEARALDALVDWSRRIAPDGQFSPADAR